MRMVETARIAVVAACAASAGAHGALVPAHLDDEAGLAVAFVVAAIVAMAASVMLTIRPSASVVCFAALLLAALLGAYALAVTTGLPWLVDEPEPVDAVALATKAVEALGLGFALQLILTTTRKEARP